MVHDIHFQFPQPGSLGQKGGQALTTFQGQAQRFQTYQPRQIMTLTDC